LIRLPLTAPAADSAQAREMDPGEGRIDARARRILVVEDSEDVRETLRACIEVLGHEVTVASNGTDGAAKLLEEQPDLALVDVGLPGMDGYALARYVRSQPGGENLSLVALTGYGGTEARDLALAAGFDLHVAKPVDLPQLKALMDFSRGADASAPQPKVARRD
jgi:two-component system, sensor histidine kinase